MLLLLVNCNTQNNIGTGGNISSRFVNGVNFTYHVFTSGFGNFSIVNSSFEVVMWGGGGGNGQGPNSIIVFGGAGSCVSTNFPYSNTFASYLISVGGAGGVGDIAATCITSE